MMKIAVVTGASSGMGREFVRQLGKKYPWLDEIWAIARRAGELELLKKEVPEVFVRPLPLDISREEERNKLDSCLQSKKPEILFLVNGAGIGIQKMFSRIPPKEAASMTELNCTALTEITGLCLPYCRKGSRIFMLASAAAFVPQPGFGVYAASKAYVVSFSRALNRELKPRKIQVTAICPGPVDTPFLEKMGGRDQMPGYKKLFIANPEAVVRKAVKDGEKGKEMSVSGFSIKALRAGCKVIRHSLILKFMEVKTDS